MFIELVMPSNHLILYYPLLLPSIFPSIRVFSNESVLQVRWPKYWKYSAEIFSQIPNKAKTEVFSFSISPSNEYSGLVSFRINWFDLLAVQGTLKSLLQHHRSKASILHNSGFFMVQLKHPYMTTGKTIALIIWTFVGKVMPLLFNMLSRLVIDLLPRSKCLLISWLHSSSAVIFETKKRKSVTVFHCFPICLPWSDGTTCHDLHFFEYWVLRQFFHSPFLLSSRDFIVPLLFLS